MEQQTLELLRALQSSERDSGAFTHIRTLLPTERTRLAAAEDRATLADISELLEMWADSAPKELAAAASAAAAQIADEDLEQAERAAQLYLRSLERVPTELDALRKLDALLCRRGEHDRLESVLLKHAEAMSAAPDAAPAAIAGVYRRLGQLRSERNRDLSSAIEAYERALDLAVDMEIVRELADLYGKRRASGDAEQAADLYCMLAELLGPQEGTPLLERALEQAPGHDATLDLLESFVPAAEQPKKLKARWQAYVQRSDNEAGTNKRRLLLAHAHAAVGEHRDAIVSLGPLIERGDADALRMQAASLAAMQEKAPRPAGTDKANAKGGNGATPRPATLVGFRMPTPAGQAAAAAETEAEPENEKDAKSGTTRPLRVRPARSGETLVGFQLPPRESKAGAEPTTKSAPSSTKPASGGAKPASSSAKAVSSSAKPAKKVEPERRSSTSSPADGARAAAKSSEASSKAIGAATTARARLGASPSPRPASQPPALAAAAAKAAALKAARAATIPAGSVNALVAPVPTARASSAPRMSGVPAAVVASSPATSAAAAAESVPVRAALPQLSLPTAQVSVSPTSFAAASDRRTWMLAGGVGILVIGAVIAMIVGPRSKHPEALAATRGEAVAPRSSAEPAVPPIPAPIPAPAAEPTVAVARPASPTPEAAAQPIPEAAPKEAAPKEAVPKEAVPKEAVPKEAAPKEAAPGKKHAAPVGHLAPGRAHVTGGSLTAQQIAIVLEDALPSIERCYNDALEQKPRTQGRAVFGWTIEKTGRPSHVRKLSGALKDETLLECSIDAIRKTKFPKPKKKTSDITWPLDYNKKG